MRWRPNLLLLLHHHPFRSPLPLNSTSTLQRLLFSHSLSPLDRPPPIPTNHHHHPLFSSPPFPYTHQTYPPTLPPLHSNVTAANRLALSHFTSGSPDAALAVLGDIPHPNLFSWNLVIGCLNQTSQFRRSLTAFRNVLALGFDPNHFTFGGVLSACVASQDSRFGEQVYSLVLRNGYISDGHVFVGLIDFFAKVGSFSDALSLFLENKLNNVVSWNAVIAGAVRNGKNLMALDLFCKMVEGIFLPDVFVFASVLSACAASGELDFGRGIHGWVVKCGADDNIFVGTATVDFYAKCQDMDAAMRNFLLMPTRNVASWTAVISGFAQKDEAVFALEIFRDMIRVGEVANQYTITSVLLACSRCLVDNSTTQVHGWILKRGFLEDVVVKNSLISTYAKIGNLLMSEKAFEENPGTWSAMISGLAKNQNSKKAIELFQRMLHKGLNPDNFCTSSVLSIVDSRDLGRQIHSFVLKSGLVLHVMVGCALFTMYSKCDCIEDSFEIFCQLPKRDRAAWTSMIAGFSEHGLADEAFQLFREMMLEDIGSDEKALSYVLTACFAPENLRKGKEVHGHAFRVGLGHGSLIAGALITLYSRCKFVASAKSVFDGAFQKDQVMWSSLVAGYFNNGHYEDGLFEFYRMGTNGFKIDEFTTSSVLGACAILPRPSLGKQLHAHVIKEGLNADLSASSGLVMMYSRCGSIDDSKRVFDEVQSPDKIAFTAMIDGYARHGRGKEALEIYELMKEQGIRPDSVTLVGVLSACSRNGLVDEGFGLFNSMSRDYGIVPQLHHYACVVDLLGRSGKLGEAAEFIDKMPIKPDSLVWSTLLAACRVHGDHELGKVAAKKLLEIQPSDSRTYISMSNIYADVGDWQGVVKIRRSMKSVGMKKEAGWSTV